MPLKLIKHTPPEPHAYTGPHLQVPLKACQHPSLDNPRLNALYKANISYTERWYLESKQLILREALQHPLIVFLREDPYMRLRLIKSTIIDSIGMKEILTNDRMVKYHMSASVNIKRLNRWCAFFSSLDQIE